MTSRCGLQSDRQEELFAHFDGERLDVGYVQIDKAAWFMGIMTLFIIVGR